MNYDPWQHAEQEHITITTHPLPPELHGLWLPTHQTILLAPTLTPTMERCVLAHELAHATLGHTHTHGTNATRQELAANRLAAQRLITREAFLSAASTTDDAGRIALDLGITPQLLLTWLRTTPQPTTHITH